MLLSGLIERSWYNERWLFSNGVRWVRLGRRGRGFGLWEQRIGKARASRWPGPEYLDGPPDPDEWYEGEPFRWEWPIRPFIIVWRSRSRRAAIMLPDRSR
jgi:hypothetical protein